jgi:hypothetical protein
MMLFSINGENVKEYQIGVIGSGRWAKIVTRELIQMESIRNKVLIFTENNFSAISSWVNDHGYKKEVQVHKGLPNLVDCRKLKIHGMIVANKAKQHIDTGYHCASINVPALIEKPIASTLDEIKAIENEFKSKKLMLAGSNVFLFSDSIENFSSMMGALQPINKITFNWSDPVNESRWGEAKLYDTSVPVFEDIFPHAIPILNRLGFNHLCLNELKILEGGSKVNLVLTSGLAEIDLTIERNAGCRKRLISACGFSGATLDLNFSSEPGEITGSNGKKFLFEGSQNASGPLSKMLRSFIRSIEENYLDERLSLDWSKSACLLSESVRGKYYEYQYGWLSEQLGGEMTPEIEYALKEISGGKEDLVFKWATCSEDLVMKQIIASNPQLRKCI